MILIRRRTLTGTKKIWERPGGINQENTSGYYELQLYRDNKSVHKVSKVSGVRYNFYPYMTKEGDYTFKVRTIPGSGIGKKVRR
ncbi:MAG: hypothetical protein ACLR0U_16755 [Enterocloster clostridioformis]